MSTISVEIPTNIAKRFGKKDKINYFDIINDYENNWWIDFDVEPKMEMSKFYNLLKQS